MRPPRFHLRTPLIAVAIAGTVLGAGRFAVVMKQRRGVCETRASSHMTSKMIADMKVEMTVAFLNSFSRPKDAFYKPKDRFLRDLRENLEAFKRDSAHHARLESIFRRAAARPWWPVPDDPPEPEELAAAHLRSAQPRYDPPDPDDVEK